MSRLYIGNLAHDTTEADLRSAFAQYGDVTSVKVMADRRGRPKGFGYVQMADNEAARRAIEELRGVQINGRTMDIVPEEGKRGGNFRPGGRRR